MRSRLNFALLGLSVGLTFNAITAIAWTAPTGAPPGNDASPPINTGSIDQVKNAGLSVNALAVYGGSYFSGNVGIGVTDPTQKLIVTGNTWLNGNLIVQSGNVGIGTANPAYALSITSGNKAVAVGDGTASDADGRVIVGWTSAVGGTPAFGSISSYMSAYKKLRVEAGPLILNSNGSSVGVGTDNPQNKLDVNGSIKVGNSGEACAASTEGSVRYNSTSKKMEYCNGTSWGPVDTDTVNPTGLTACRVGLHGLYSGNMTWGNYSSGNTVQELQVPLNAGYDAGYYDLMIQCY